MRFSESLPTLRSFTFRWRGASWILQGVGSHSVAPLNAYKAAVCIWTQRGSFVEISIGWKNTRGSLQKVWKSVRQGQQEGPAIAGTEVETGLLGTKATLSMSSPARSSMRNPMILEGGCESRQHSPRPAQPQQRTTTGKVSPMEAL